MMRLLTLHSNRTAAIDCLVRHMPLVRRAMDRVRATWQAQLATVDRANKVSSTSQIMSPTRQELLWLVCVGKAGL
jgi:hypothetical protein